MVLRGSLISTLCGPPRHCDGLSWRGVALSRPLTSATAPICMISARWRHARRSRHLVRTRNSSGVVDIRCLASCPRLVSLDISGCSGEVNVTPLAASCNSLMSLCMNRCAAVTDVRALSVCIALTCIDLSRCSAVTDIRALAACKPSLDYIDVGQSGASLADVALEAMGEDEGYWLRQPLLLPPLSFVS